MSKPKRLVESKIQDTYNIQVVEQRSHSFAFRFPPKGDFAPEAHYTPSPKRVITPGKKKDSRSSTIWVSKSAQIHKKRAAANKGHIAGHVRHQKEN